MRSPLVTPLGIIATFTRKEINLTKRISSALALIFVFSLGQFALALNTSAPTLATTTSAQEQNQREDMRDRKHGRRWRHKRHRHPRIMQQGRREYRRGDRNRNRPPS